MGAVVVLLFLLLFPLFWLYFEFGEQSRKSIVTFFLTFFLIVGTIFIILSGAV